MMLSSQPQRKTTVILTDYAYLQDIENRILMAHLSVFEVYLLQEIVHHSLKISIDQFAKELNVKVDYLLSVLKKLEALKLFKIQGLTLLVDKEARKYFEFQLEKFDEDFRPNLDFVQNVLNKVPIHVLPVWYVLPRCSDHIFSSIIEKYLLTPKIYRQYLKELETDHPLLYSIIQDVHQAPHFKMTAHELMIKYQFSRDQFEEHLLLLEYYLACYLSYERIEDEWQEIVTPFFEWSEYLNFEFKTRALPISVPITTTYYKDFNFIEDFNTVLKACESKKIKFTNVKNLKLPSSLHPHLIHKLIQIEFVQLDHKDQMLITEKGKDWLSKLQQEQIAQLATDPLYISTNHEQLSYLWNPRNLHLIEKSLRRLIPNQWVELDQFLEGLIAPIGNKEAVVLKNKGKKWKYERPSYNDQERLFVQTVIMERLGELGIVHTGLIENKFCFCLTNFGNHFIH